MTAAEKGEGERIEREGGRRGEGERCRGRGGGRGEEQEKSKRYNLVIYMTMMTRLLGSGKVRELNRLDICCCETVN